MSWGHKITISVYVEGELPEQASVIAAEGAESALRLRHIVPPEITFVGASVEPVETEPKEEGGS